jgi:superfamily II DNA or RNA helicase
MPRHLPTRHLPPGLYEIPVSERLDEEIASLAGTTGLAPEVDALDAGATPEIFARRLHDLALRALRGLHGDDRVARQLSLTNRLIAELATATEAVLTSDRLVDPPRELRAVHEPGAPSSARRRPGIPLRTSDLLVNGPRDLRLGPEIHRELASADRVDLLVSFLKWSGVRILLDGLDQFLSRRPGGLRILTTTYLGATDPQALEALADRGAEIRVSYDRRRTRLHAKAWLFHRDSDFSTAFVGSSNLSAPAILDGLEWNVRLSTVDNRPLLEKFAATFEQYWQDPSFIAFDREQFRRAVARERADDTTVGLFALRPYPHQEEILEALATERDAGHRRNLVVAATGTGKTLVAAFDYQRLCDGPRRPSLLFVAHREEILRQAREIYRHVLADGSFGELLVSGDEPTIGQHVFASIQSLHERRLARLRPDAWDVVVVDEFHHAAAATYQRLLTTLRPQYLLGLTATPERSDGHSVLGWFDGRIAAEMRLWSALERGLLSPFQYFGIADGTDLSQLTWQGGYLDRDLDKLYTGNHLRVAKILRALRDIVRNVATMRAFGFCAGVAHARFMAERFDAAGIPAVAVHADTPREARKHALDELRAGRLNVIFTVDLFNEGVDLPAADTVLFLRPTQSATLFLQQLGRGLRLEEGKDCLTVLDFIGNAHQRFRFDRNFRAITGSSRRQFAQEVAEGFPTLPPGCAIHLDRQVQEWVLANVRRALDAGRSGLLDDLRSLGDVPLAEFLDRSGLEPSDLYRGGRTYSDLRRAAGFGVAPAGPEETSLGRALARMLHIDDDQRLDAWRSWLADDAPPAAAPLTSWEGRLQAMLFAALGHLGRPLTDLPTCLGDLWRHPALRAELRELLDLLADRRRRQACPLHLEPAAPNLPIRSHATYSLDEIMAGFGVVRGSGLYRPRGQGVWYDEASRSDLLFVTLRKTEREYSPTTLYADYPLSPTEFHWESQNAVAPSTSVGKRYLSGASHVVLFVRSEKRDDRGETVPYLCLGRARLLRAESERPMRIVWRLDRPAPGGWFEHHRIAAA